MSQRICSILDCDRPVLVKKRGWCSMHYCRWQAHGDPTAVTPRPRVVGVERCTIEGCDKAIAARGWCTAHWTRWKRHGSPTARLRGEVVDGRRICTMCGEDKLVDTEINGSWCKVCAASRKAEWREAHSPDDKSIPCRACGERFIPLTPAQKHCSSECARRTINEAGRPYSTARRARAYGSRFEKFDYREIYERDGWVCGICSDPVDPDVKWPDPMSVSLDHVIPLSRGGSHSRENAQCAHLGCNCRKGARTA